MIARRKTDHAFTKGRGSTKNDATIVFGEKALKAGFLQVPKVVFSLARYHSAKPGELIQPRHLLLLLCLAARKYKDKPIRAYWAELSQDLGVKPGTVRKWASELKAMGLLGITQHRGRDPEKNLPGIRNERNSFDIRRFVELVEESAEKRQEVTRTRRARRRTGEAR